MGTDASLALNSNGKFIAYGYGFYPKTQSILNELYRVAPSVIYNYSTNFKMALEYDLTTASYGTIQSSGVAINPTSVTNHRILATVSYIF